MRLLEYTESACMCCGRGNTPNNDGTRPTFVDLERDVNWNDPAVLCEECAMKVGALVGMLSEDSRRELQQELRDKDKEVHDIRAEMDSMRRRATRLGLEFKPPKKKAA